MIEDTCCTCARLLSTILLEYDEKTEKPIATDRRLECCNRIICGGCIVRNRRFATYCPFCQISSDPTPLPQGLQDPPAYSPPLSPGPAHTSLAPLPSADDLPAYSSLDIPQDTVWKTEHFEDAAEDVLHFVDPIHDSITSLALKYTVPSHALRKKNNLYADHLLTARKAILIPGEYYKGGISLSPQPIDGEEEETRKSKIRRWMITCKVSDYDIALLYLNQAKYDIDSAVEAYLSDEKWERENPMASSSNVKPSSSRKRPKFSTQMGISGQL